MEGTADSNLNDNREKEYLLRACANAVQKNTAGRGIKKVKNGKRALGRKRAYY